MKRSIRISGMQRLILKFENPLTQFFLCINFKISFVYLKSKVARKTASPKVDKIIEFMGHHNRGFLKEMNQDNKIGKICLFKIIIPFHFSIY